MIWIGVLPLIQPEQINRRFVEKALRRNQIRDALTYMSARERSDFPPHWDPPPRIGYGDETPDIWEIVALADGGDIAPWVRSIYNDKILAQSGIPFTGERRLIDLSNMDEQNLRFYVELLREAPAGPSRAAYHSHEIKRILAGEQDPEQPEPIPDWRRELLTEILALGDSEELRESPAPAHPTLPDC